MHLDLSILTDDEIEDHLRVARRTVRRFEDEREKRRKKSMVCILDTIPIDAAIDLPFKRVDDGIRALLIKLIDDVVTIEVSAYKNFSWTKAECIQGDKHRTLMEIIITAPHNELQRVSVVTVKERRTFYFKGCQYGNETTFAFNQEHLTGENK